MPHIKPSTELVQKIQTFLQKQSLWTDDLKQDIPKHWEKRGDMIVFKSKCFTHSVWNQIDRTELWEIVCGILKCKKLAQRQQITTDCYRTPMICLIKGDSGWVTHVDNGIKYTWDITKCMYSGGNITEKLRISRLNCEDEIVVDLYAGIGYFTLPYLVHAKAKMVYACEWNPSAVEALKKGLQLNNVEDRCVIHEGDNRQVCPKNIAHRVNLGLIPTSEPSWNIACEALRRDTGGVLHIHGNIDMKTNPDTAVTEWRNYVHQKIQNILHKLWNNREATVEILHIEKVKSYAPHVDHLVIDIKCVPNDK